jgi:hypothetical protein
MKLYIIQFLLIIILALIFGILEFVNSNITLMLYRGTITYIIAAKLAILINRMESTE